MHLELSYISCACNSVTNACDWGENNLICYSSCNSVIIFNPKFAGTNKDLKILTGHKDKVCVVKWLKIDHGIPEKELVSTSKDGNVIIWTLDNDDYQPTYLKGHTEGVNVADCLYTNAENGDLVIATSSIDGTIKIWKRLSFGGECINSQTINLKRGICLGLALTSVPGTSSLLLACGRDTSKVELYLQNEYHENQSFKLVQTLTGYENWIPGLDFAVKDNGDLLLATSSQDKFIRIWCISLNVANKTEDEAKDCFVFDKDSVSKEIYIDTTNGKKKYLIALDAVLCGHEAWVYEVKWAPKTLNQDGNLSQPMKLLSCSLDKTMIIWTLQESTGLWMENVRVGEIGGNTLGFYGCKYSPDGLSVIGHGYLGSFHLWNYNPELDVWQPGVVPSGHSNQVVDCRWEPEGEFVISVSLDQTTRVHAPWVTPNIVSWHEIARPQVHGYDMSCIAILSRYRLASGAEEKIVRIFQAPSNFVENFSNLCDISDRDIEYITNGPKGASVPSLGLSNKAVYESSNEEQVKPTGKEYYAEETYFHEIHLEAPPPEEDLIQNTLWPEVQKLYGHGYEVYAICCSHDSQILATSCRATTAPHASIILWDTNTWEQLQKLTSHTLTVTQISFSPDNNKILSVSRDRRLSVFEKDPETKQYNLAATTDKKTGVHTRIIWCCAWSHDSQFFVTGSRDGKVVIWHKNEQKDVCDTVLKNYESLDVLEHKEQSVTAIAFAPCFIQDFYLICIGFESGELMIYKWNMEKKWNKCLHVEQSIAHHRTVKRIHFRPKLGRAGVKNEDENILQIASCGSDHSVRVYDLYLKVV